MSQQLFDRVDASPEVQSWDPLNANPTEFYSRTWFKSCVVSLILVAGVSWSGWRGTQRLMSGAGGDPNITLDMTVDDWIKANAGLDAACYLDVARNYAAGRGVVETVPGTNPAEYRKFYWWAPGAPVVFGRWLQWTGGQTMWTFFWFTLLAQFLFGVIAVATAALWTRNLKALGLVALGAGICPPLQDWVYGLNMTTAEIVGLVPFALALFALSKGFLAYRRAAFRFATASYGVLRSSFSLPTWFWFLVAGALLGAFSLVRDCGHGFAIFVAAFIVLRTLLTDWRRLALAAAAASLLIAGDMAARAKTQRWNNKRIDLYVVCTGTESTLWRQGLWEQHDLHPWFITHGLGFGHFLDPDAAVRVEEYYQQEQPLPSLYSLGQLVRAIAKRPFDAVTFKLARQPVLWLGTDVWPNCQLGLTPLWCLAHYLLLVTYAVVQWRRRKYIPETLYLYLLLVVASAPIVHEELRFTIPIWSTLVFVPGLLFDALAQRSLSAAHQVEPDTNILPFQAVQAPRKSKARAAA
jgi:hypothetical protein